MLKTQMKSWAKTNKSGFTIVELLIVIIVIGILASLILVAYSNVTNQAKNTTLQADLTQANKQLNIDKERGGGSTYPASLAAANSGNGIVASSGNTSAYFTNTALTTYCLNENNGSTTYYVSSTSQKPATGTCASAGYGTAGWWQLDGNATDSSGNGLNGTISGPTTTTGADGSANGAYSFAANTNLISLPASSLINTPVFTYSAWIKPTSVTNSDTILGGSSANGPQFRIDSVTTKTQLLKEFVTGVGLSTAIPPLNTWTNVAVTYDASGNYAFYTNGALTGSGTNLQSFSFSNLQIGKGNGTGETFVGAIDDVRIFSRALNATEIMSIYTAGAQ